MWNEIRQTDAVKGIFPYNNEIKLSQFADETNLFCANVASVEAATAVINQFGEISALKLNIEKIKAMWLDKWANKLSETSR